MSPVAYYDILSIFTQIPIPLKLIKKALQDSRYTNPLKLNLFIAIPGYLKQLYNGYILPSCWIIKEIYSMVDHV